MQRPELVDWGPRELSREGRGLRGIILGGTSFVGGGDDGFPGRGRERGGERERIGKEGEGRTWKKMREKMEN